MSTNSLAAAPITRVAIAVQDPQIRRLLAMALRLEAFEPHVLVGGEQVVDTLIREPYVAAIVEGQLAPLDGFTICSRVHAATTTPIILLLMQDDATERNRAGEAGASAVLFLPFNMSELRECLAVVSNG